MWQLLCHLQLFLSAEVGDPAKQSEGFSDPSLVGTDKGKYHVFLRLTLFESHAANYIHSDFFPEI